MIVAAVANTFPMKQPPPAITGQPIEGNDQRAAAAAPLAVIQRWMQAIIAHPGGAGEGMQSLAAQQCIPLSLADVESVISPSRSLTGLYRLEIYARAYYARLLECLREEFPVLLKAMGEELFDEFAVDYLQKYPPRSYTLAELGRDFARFLRETRPASASRDDNAWPDFLIELAQLEWNFNDVFDGPGCEEARPLDADWLRGISADRWDSLVLVPAPCLRLLVFRYAVHRYYSSLRKGEGPVPPERVETFLAVTRQDYVVRHYEISGMQYELLSMLMAGQRLGAAIASLFAGTDGDEARVADQLPDWFRRWSAEGFFVDATFVGSG